jgi:hypothetical protein
MIERAITPCPRRWGHRTLEAAITVLVACVATDPGAILRKVDQVFVHAWKTAGEAIVDRELTALAGMLENDRADLTRAEALRDALAVRLEALEDRRSADALESVSVCSANDRNRDRPRTGPNDADIDGAISTLRSTIARADHYINSARRLVRAREADLGALHSLAESQRARRELSELDGVLPRWEGRARFAAELLGSSSPAAD